MKFVSSRELRINPGTVWKKLDEAQDLVITSNGRPVGVLTRADENNLEDVLATLRAGRAQRAVREMRQAALARGLDRMSPKSLEDIIRKSRQGDRKVAAGGRR